MVRIIWSRRPSIYGDIETGGLTKASLARLRPYENEKLEANGWIFDKSGIRSPASSF